MTNKIIWVLIFFGLIDATEAKQSNESPLREPITASSGAKELILIVGPDTNRISAIDLKATRYRKTGDFDAAIAEYRKIIKLYEQSALKVDVKNSLIIHYIRKIAACYKGKKDFDSAIKEYLSMMALAKAYSWQETAELAVLAVIESALQSGQYDQEVTGYEENVLSEVQNESTLLTLAYLYRKYRRYNRAIAEYRKFIRKYPKSRYIGDARYSLGSCYLARAQESTSSDEFFRNYEAALAEFKAALDYSTYDINRLDQTINSIINCYITLNRKKALDRFLSDYREKFLSNCRRVIVERANTPDAALAQYYIGRFWFRENKYDQAIEEFSRVLSVWTLIYIIKSPFVLETEKFVIL